MLFLFYKFYLLDVLHALNVLDIPCEVVMVLRTGPVYKELLFFLLFRYNGQWLWLLVEGRV